MAHDNITINIQSSIRIATSAGILYFDPLGINEKVADADYIFITHDHFDHFSPEAISNIANDTTILIVPEKMYDRAVSASGINEKHIVSVNPNETYDVSKIEFETVAAYNNLKPFHPKSAGWCGYIIFIDGTRYYIAGDTDITIDNKSVVCDVALVPVGGTYTMDARSAAELINRICPRTAIPTHYGKIAGNPGDGKEFASMVDHNIEVVIKL